MSEASNRASRDDGARAKPSGMWRQHASQFEMTAANPQWIILLGAAFSLFILVVNLLILAPSFASYDVYYFKDAAINLVQGLGFTSRFTYGNPDFTYHDYAQYPPIYPLLFAINAKLFGVSLVSNQLFNTVVALATGWAGFWALAPALPADRRLRGTIGAAILLLALFCGFCQADPDRPDCLAVAVGLVVLILTRSQTSPRWMAAIGALGGVLLFISPFAGVWTALTAGVVLLSHAGAGRWRAVAASLAWAALGGAAAAIVIVGLIGLLLPGWFAAFLGVLTGSSTHNETGGGYFISLLHGDIRGWSLGLNLWGSHRELMTLGLADMALLVGLVRDRPPPKGPSIRASIAILVLLSPFCVVIAPYEYNYMRISAFILLAAAAGLVVGRGDRARRAYGPALLAGFVLASAVGLPRYMKSYAIRATTRPSLERAEKFIAAHRSEFDGARADFAVSPEHYMLWRQMGVRPLITVFTGFRDPSAQDRLQRVEVNYSNTQNLTKPALPTWFHPQSYVLEHTPALPQQPRLFGVRLSRSSETWEGAFYVRRAGAGSR